MTLNYLLRLSDSAFTGPANRARGTVDKLNAGVANVGKGAAGVNNLGGSFARLTPLIMTAGAALAAAALAGVGFAVKTAASTEQTMIQFETLTGSMQQAKATLQELQDLGAATPFELPQLTEAAKKLLAARVPTAALKSELTALGNVSAATGADLGGLATVYGQMAGKGKIYAEDMQQFVEAGAGEIKASLAESLGVSTSALNDLMSDGRVGFSDMQKALQGLAGAQGKWGDAMAKQSRTTIGMFSTLKDNVTSVFRVLGEPINDGPVKAWLQTAVQATGQLPDLFRAAINGADISELMGAAFDLGLKKAWNALIELDRKITAWNRAVWSSVADTAKAAWIKISEGISGLLSMGWKGALNAFIEGVKGLPDRIWPIFEKIKEYGKAVLTLDFDKLGKFSDLMHDAVKFDTTDEEKKVASLAGKVADYGKGLDGASKLTDQAATAADGWAKSLDAVTAAADKSEASAKAGASTAETGGRRRIRSLRDGSTLAKSSERNTVFGGESQWKQLQQRVLSGPNEGQFANLAFGGKGYGPQGKARMMGGGLDAWHAANPGEMNRFKRPLAVAPAIQSPGAAQVNEKKAATAAKTAEKIQGGGGDRPRWDLVAQIAANTANLKVIK